MLLSDVLQRHMVQESRRADQVSPKKLPDLAFGKSKQIPEHRIILQINYSGASDHPHKLSESCSTGYEDQPERA